MPREITLIVIHCSASPDGVSLFEGEPGAPGFTTPVEVIDRWHAKRGFRRALQWRERMNPDLASIGYHFVLYTNGATVTGRHMDEVGAHVVGNNLTSLGICMIGTERFTRDQWRSLKQLVELLQLKYPSARVCGHRDLSPDQNNDGLVEPWEWLKTCPGFDVAAWLEREMEPDPRHVIEPLAPQARAEAQA
jgi:hypothetical protein